MNFLIVRSKLHVINIFRRTSEVHAPNKWFPRNHTFILRTKFPKFNSPFFIFFTKRNIFSYLRLHTTHSNRMCQELSAHIELHEQGKISCLSNAFSIPILYFTYSLLTVCTLNTLKKLLDHTIPYVRIKLYNLFTHKMWKFDNNSLFHILFFLSL